MLGLIWAQAFCKNYQQTTLVGKELNYIVILVFTVTCNIWVAQWLSGTSA